MKHVVVFGTFDILHPGHLYFLKEAKKYGDYLTVVVSRDDRASSDKKRFQVFSEKDRVEMLNSLNLVNSAILGDKVGEWKVLQRLNPDVVCIGYDQKKSWIDNCALKDIPLIVKIKKYKEYSSRKYARH